MPKQSASQGSGAPHGAFKSKTQKGVTDSTTQIQLHTILFLPLFPTSQPSPFRMGSYRTAFSSSGVFFSFSVPCGVQRIMCKAPCIYFQLSVPNLDTR